MMRRKLSTFTPGASAETFRGQASSGTNVLETIQGVCDGRTVPGANGPYTLGDATYQTSSTTVQIMNGSSINYLPPAGTKTVIYKLWFSWMYVSSAYICLPHYGVQIDGTLINNSRWSTYHYRYSNYDRPVQQDRIVGVIRVTGTDNKADGQLASWDSAKTIRVQFDSYDSSQHRVRLHELVWWNGTSTNIYQTAGQERHPWLEITALST